MNKRPGRPPLDAADPSVKVTLTLPSKQLTELVARSTRERLSLAEYLRSLLPPYRTEKSTLK